MLHSISSDTNQKEASRNTPCPLSASVGLLPLSRSPLAALQSAMGNQAMLRFLNSSDRRSLKSNPTGSATGVLRQCACGGGGSNCAECEKKETLRQLGPNEEESPYSAADSRLRQSGTCQNGGAASDCDSATGIFSLQQNDNTCCTKECTAAHEAVHAQDVNGWGCCKAYSVAYNARGADKAALRDKYVDWIGRIRAITECHAYTHDVKCAGDLAKTKDCNGAGKDTDCCKDIAEYKTKYAAKAKEYCDAAPARAPSCPAF